MTYKEHLKKKDGVVFAGLWWLMEALAAANKENK